MSPRTYVASYRSSRVPGRRDNEPLVWLAGFLPVGRSSDLPTAEHCSRHSPARYLSLAVLQDNALFIGNLISLLYGKDVDGTLAWRTHRRLLSAMKRLPDSDMSSQEIKAALFSAPAQD